MSLRFLALSSFANLPKYRCQSGFLGMILTQRARDFAKQSISRAMVALKSVMLNKRRLGQMQLPKQGA
jgi:hypothetical protein